MGSNPTLGTTPTHKLAEWYPELAEGRSAVEVPVSFSHHPPASTPCPRFCVVPEWYPELAEGRSRRMVRVLKRGAVGTFPWFLKGAVPDN